MVCFYWSKWCGLNMLQSFLTLDFIVTSLPPIGPSYLSHFFLLIMVDIVAPFSLIFEDFFWSADLLNHQIIFIIVQQSSLVPSPINQVGNPCPWPTLINVLVFTTIKRLVWFPNIEPHISQKLLIIPCKLKKFNYVSHRYW